jgi:hypothetical protein
MRARALSLLSGCFLLSLAGSASAASLSVSAPPNAYVGDVITVTTSGSTEQHSSVWTYYDLSGTDCAVTLGDERARVNVGNVDLRFPDAGSFTLLSQFQPGQAAVYRLCGYLYYSGDNDDTTAPRAAATTTVTVSPPPDRDGDGKPDSTDACPDVAASTSNGCPPPPPSDRDGDGKPDSTDACPEVAASTSDGCPLPPDQDGDGRPDYADWCPTLPANTEDGCPRPIAPVLSGEKSQRASSSVTVHAACNRPCQLSAVGVIGGRKLRGAGPVLGGTTATMLRLRVSARQLKSIRKNLKKHKTTKAVITVNALYPSGTSLASRRSLTLTR